MLSVEFVPSESSPSWSRAATGGGGGVEERECEEDEDEEREARRPRRPMFGSIAADGECRMRGARNEPVDEMEEIDPSNGGNGYASSIALKLGSEPAEVSDEREPSRLRPPIRMSMSPTLDSNEEPRDSTRNSTRPGRGDGERARGRPRTLGRSLGTIALWSASGEINPGAAVRVFFDCRCDDGGDVPTADLDVACAMELSALERLSLVWSLQIELPPVELASLVSSTIVTCTDEESR